MGVLFLDLRKAFDMVDHRVLVSKLSQMGLSNNSLFWIESYLFGRTQVMSVNNNMSKPGKVECGVPQGSILGPLFFILYVNSLPSILDTSSVYLYADDSAIAVSGTDTDAIVEQLKCELVKADIWLKDHKLSLNLSKTKLMFFGTNARLPKKGDINIEMNGIKIEHVDTYKYLGVTLDSRLTFSHHTEMVRRKAFPKIRTLGRIRSFVSQDTIIYLYKSLVLSQIEYADIVYDGLSQTDRDFLQKVQNAGLRTVLNCNPRTPINVLHEMADLKTLKARCKDHVCQYVYKRVHGMSMPEVNSMFTTLNTVALRTTRAVERRDLAVPVAL